MRFKLDYRWRILPCFGYSAYRSMQAFDNFIKEISVLVPSVGVVGWRHYRICMFQRHASVANVSRSKARSSNGVLSSVTIFPIVGNSATLSYEAGHPRGSGD